MSFASKLREAYKKADIKLGGLLPGGVKPTFKIDFGKTKDIIVTKYPSVKIPIIPKGIATPKVPTRRTTSRTSYIIPKTSSLFTPSSSSRLPTSIKSKGIDTRRLKAGAIEAADIISGGALTERRLNKKESAIFKDIEGFNKNFSGRELNESEFKTATNRSKTLRQREVALQKERDKLAKSARSRITTAFDISRERLTAEQKKERVKSSKSLIEKRNKQIEDIDKKLKEEFKKKNTSGFKVSQLKGKKNLLFKDISRLKEGKLPEIYMGTVPISGAGIPGGVTKIQFIGTQKKAKGGKIITDIVFRTAKGRVGVAKGVAITKGKGSASIVLGRSGKMAFKFPSGKQKLISVKSFIGKETALTLPTKVKLTQNLNLLEKGKKIGTIKKTIKNVQVFKQAGIGRVASVKGKKFFYPSLKFPTGKIVTTKARGIGIDDFGSISAILTKKDLSLIVGKSITAKGAKANFIGMIKGGAGSQKYFSGSGKQQYAKALQKVLASTSAALAKAEKTKGLSKTGTLAYAAKLASDSIKLSTAKPVVKPIVKQVTKAKPKPVTVVKTDTKTAQVPDVITKPRSRSGSRSRTTPVQAPAQKQIPKQKPISIPKSKSKAKAKTKQRYAVSPKLMQREIALQTGNKGALAKGVKFMPVGAVKKKKKATKKTTTKKVKKKQAYNVYARPKKKKTATSKPRGIKVNKVPLTKTRAKNLRNYVTDTSLSRTARTRKTKGKPKKPKVKAPSGYAKRTSNKFRTYKIVNGKRKPLPKGTVIEKRKYLLDTKQEKKQITVRKRIRQIQKPVKRISQTKRNTVKKTNRAKAPVKRKTSKTTPKTNRPKPKAKKKR